MIEPLPYRKHDGWFGLWEIEMTPDGWKDPKTDEIIRDSGYSEKLLEYINVIKNLMRAIPDLESMRKYFAKYGTKIKGGEINPTLAFSVERQLMDYTIELEGSRIYVYAHSK